MKICFDYEIFWKQRFSGIASRYFYNLIKTLLNYNYLDVKVFSKYYFNEKLDELPKNVVIGNKLKYKIPYTGKLIEKLNSLISNSQILNFNPDIIHKTYYSNKISLNKKKKIILTVFDLWHEKNSGNKIRPKEYSLNISDHILCPSFSTKKDLIEIYNIDEKKVSVTYFGIEKFDKNQLNQNKHYNHDPYILYVGARGRYKNFNNFIKAYSDSEKLKNNFKIICFGGANFSDEEHKNFDQLRIANYIQRENNTDDKTLFNLYKNARCLVYTSAHEGLGLPPLEAMSLGCPTITSNYKAILEGVGEASGVFDPNDISQIKEIIEKYIFSDDKLKELINLGYSQSKKFSWEKCTNETLEVYKKVLG